MELPQPDISRKPHEKPEGFYTASGNPSLKRSNPGAPKVAFNVLAALALTALAAWLLFEDLLYPGDPLFQMSWSLPAIALFVGAFSVLAFFLAIFPKRIVIGANVLLILRSAFGYPLTIWTDNAIASKALSAALLVFALVYLACSLRKLIRIDARPWFRLSHSFSILGLGILLAVLALPVTLLGFTHAGRNVMGDYVRLSPQAISLVERVFRKGEQRVHLVGMMHIGNGSYYDALEERMAAPPEGEGTRRLVLTEGVSDRDKILPESFASGQIYARWAQFFGLEVQEAFHGPSSGHKLERDRLSVDGRIRYHNADIDISELDPAYRETLVELLELIDETDPVKLLLGSPGDVSGPEVESLFIDGLIEGRNDGLMKEFEVLAPKYDEIYIPWGAAHLTDVEKRLRDLGYEQVDEAVRPIVSFSGLLPQHRD